MREKDEAANGSMMTPHAAGSLHAVFSRSLLMMLAKKRLRILMETILSLSIVGNGRWCFTSVVQNLNSSKLYVIFVWIIAGAHVVSPSKTCRPVSPKRAQPFVRLIHLGILSCKL